MKTKPPLLFLCHRIPFPPNKGDKIRSWHLLKHLAKDHQVFIGCFVDDEHDWQYISDIQNVCEKSYFAKLDPKMARLKSLSGFCSGKALSIPYYFDKALQQWVKYIIESHNIKQVVVYSSAMAQYVLDNHFFLENKIIDFVDVDSDKWLQYAKNKNWPMSYIYRREAKKLLAFDRKVADQFDLSLFVSQQEAALFKTLAPESAEKIFNYNNGVDSEYFSPEQHFKNPYAPSSLPIVFTGAMDYWPNIDAVIWFANEIFPKIKNEFPQSNFYIVGSKPSDEVVKLGGLPGINVTGRVEDVRPYLQHANVAVAPMRIARGIQNKVLEAMAMNKIVVVTPEAMEGINAKDGSEVFIADNPATFQEILQRSLLGHPINGESDHNHNYNHNHVKTQVAGSPRERVLKDFNWDNNLGLLDQWLLDQWLLDKSDQSITSPELAEVLPR